LCVVAAVKRTGRAKPCYPGAKATKKAHPINASREKEQSKENKKRPPLQLQAWQIDQKGRKKKDLANSPAANCSPKKKLKREENPLRRKDRHDTKVSLRKTQAKS